jgi:hypothetical protein
MWHKIGEYELEVGVWSGTQHEKMKKN